MKNKYTPSETALLKRIGNNIRRIRKEKKVSQETLAGESETERSYMSGIECGKGNPTVIKLKDIADTLGVDVSEFFKINKK
jgi:transcriptional regulator with XRE-family HTH domain